MRLHCAVLEIPAKSSVPPGSPLNKPRSLSTHSESTLPQTLIPLDFISFISNVYRKPGEGHSVPAQKFVNSSLAVRRSCEHARIRTTRFCSWSYLMTCGHPGGGVSLRWDSQSWLSLLGLPQFTDHEPPLLLVRRYRCAAMRKVPESPVLQLCGTGKQIRSARCLKYRERTSGRQCQNAVPVASRSQNAGQGDRTRKKAWVQRSKAAF
jgi:hypothetical protein